MINELVDYIETNTSLVIGTDLWPNYFPKEEDLGVTISLVGGTENESLMQRHLLQIMSIAADANTAYTNCETVYELFAFNNGMTLLTAGLIFNCVSMSTPKFVHINKHNYPVYTASVVIIKAR